MNGEQIIPPITDPIGRNWEQPHRRYIEVDSTHALMSEQTFKGLMEYSSSLPSGKYYGKMWRRCAGRDRWYLGWYCEDSKGDPLYIGIEWREILIV